MSALAADNTFDFDFSYPYASIEEYDYEYQVDSQSSSQEDIVDLTVDLESSPASTMPTYFDPSLLEIPYSHTHNRSSSRSSIYSTFSNVESTADTVSTRLSTPPRASPPIRNHGPILLPKIRPQDQDLEAANVAATIPRKRRNNNKSLSTPPAKIVKRQSVSAHARSYTNPESLNSIAYAHLASFATPTPVSHIQRQQIQEQQHDDSFTNSLLCSPVSFVQNVEQPSRRASCANIDGAAIEKYGYPTYRQLPYHTAPQPQQQQQQQEVPQDLMFSTSYNFQAPSPLSISSTPEPVAAVPVATSTTNLMSYLTAANPTASLVRTLNFPHRDPNIKHFWWDIRSVRPWADFTPKAIHALPSLSTLLQTPVPSDLLPTPPSFASRHPETEAALHAIHAAHYIPKLNAALAISSPDPIQFSLPKQPVGGKPSSELLFLASAASDASTATAIFGGKPISRVVGLTRSYDRFNTGMRSEGNIKKVEYLKGLSALHHQMREHSTRYGFILTEIELVLVRAGTESTPFFGDLEITSIPLASSSSGESNELTACLALFALTHLFCANEPPHGQPMWKAEIGAPAEGTRRKAKAKESWIPVPQLAEKREAKRSRGWVWPEDAVGRKELGKRGVKYGNI